MANVTIQVSPATYENGLVTVVYPHTPISRETVEVKNAAELKEYIKSIRINISTPSKIFVTPVGRKMRGFDKFKSDNVSLFQIRPENV